MMRALALALALATATGARADEIEIDGEAALLGTDRDKARQRALDEAFRAGLEKTLTDLWGDVEMKRRSSELRVRVYPNVRAYIASYRVIDENEISGTYHVRVAAQFSADKIAALRGNAPTVTRPLTAVLCARGVEAELVAKAADHALAREGYKSTRVKGVCAANSLSSETPYLIVSGEVGQPERIRGTTFVGAEARVQIDRTRGAQHDVASETAVTYAEGALPTAKISAAYEQAADSAVKKLFGDSAKTGGTKSGVPLKIVGINDYAGYAAVVRTTAQLPDVRGVTAQRFARSEADVFVNTALDAMHLADLLRRASLAVQPQPDGTLLVTLPRADGT